MNRLPGDEFTTALMGEVVYNCKILNISCTKLITESIDAVIMAYWDNPSMPSIRADYIMGLHNAGLGVIMMATKRIIQCIGDPDPLDSRDDWISRIYNRYRDKVEEAHRGSGPGPVNKQIACQVISMCADNFFN